MRILRIFMIIILFPSILMAQYSPREIDSLMTKEIYRLRDENNNSEIVKVSRKVIQDSKKIEYKKGEIYGYARLGNALCNLKEYKKALEALNEARQKIDESKIEDYVIRASINLGIGRCYSDSKVSYENALLHFDKALESAQKINNIEEKKLYLRIIYSNYYSIYSNLQKEEEAANYLRKILKVKEDAYTLISLARYHNIYTHDKDSAKFYLDKTQTYDLNNFEKSAFYNQMGRYYEEQKEYQKAIDFYKKAEQLSIKINEIGLLDMSLSGLYNTYQKKGDLKNAIYYSNRRVLLKDSMNNLQTNNYDIAINDIVQQKEKAFNQKLSSAQKIYIVLALLVLLSFLILGVRIYQNKKERKKVQHIIREQEIELKEKEDITTHLQQKVNESFDELIKLAKSNSPEFFTRFKEVYPEKIARLLEIDPKFRVSELTLCAYILLGFKTKDIALYTYKSVNTIRNRKYNLRKKLSIAEEQDMEIWFKSL